MRYFAHRSIIDLFSVGFLVPKDLLLCHFHFVSVKWWSDQILIEVSSFVSTLSPPPFLDGTVVGERFGTVWKRNESEGRVIKPLKQCLIFLCRVLFT